MFHPIKSDFQLTVFEIVRCEFRTLNFTYLYVKLKQIITIVHFKSRDFYFDNESF